MLLDDLALALQRAIDHFIRRLRRGSAPECMHRRLLIVQIDGLSRVVLERGLASGYMLFLNHLLRAGHRLEPMTVGLPISAGPNAFLYVLDARAPLDLDAVEQRFPGLAEQLSRSPGVDFVLARSAGGPLCFRQGRRYQLRDSAPGPFAERADAAAVMQGIADLMAMQSAGDLVIYGIDAPEGHVSFLPEVGANAGPSPEELHTFVLHPGQITLPAPITHPVQLYDHFISYQEQYPATPLDWYRMK
jgi:hypothetical protein